MNEISDLPDPPKTTAQIAREALIERKRGEANAAGRPIRRTRCVGTALAGVPTFYLHLHNDRLVVRDVIVTPGSPVTFNASDSPVEAPAFALSSARPMSAADVIRLVDVVHDADATAYHPGPQDLFRALRVPPRQDFTVAVTRVAVLADQATLKKTIQVVREVAVRGASPTTYQTLRLLEYRASLPMSAHLPVLTEALARAWWLPGDLDEFRIETWADLFGDGDDVSSFPQLLLAAIDGDSSAVGGIISAEKYGSISSRYISTNSAVKAYKRAQSLGAANDAMIAVDPLLVEANTIEGIVAKCRVEDQSNGYGQLRVSVSNNIKIKSDSHVVLFSPSSASQAKLSVVAVTADESEERIRLLLRAPKSGRYNSALNDLLSTEDLYLSPAPFLGGGKVSDFTGRWVADGSAPVAPSRGGVPADIIAAGAPG